MAPSSPSYPQSEQQIRRSAARPIRKTFTHYCPVYFAGLSCNSPLFCTAQGNGMKHERCQKKGKVEETAWDLPSTASVLQLYIFVRFLTKVLVVPLKMLAGMWTLEWEGCCKDRMSQPCKPATDVLLQCIVSSQHSVPLLLDGKFIWERKILVKLTQEYQSQKLLKIIPGHLFREKGCEWSGNGETRSGMRKHDLGIHRSRRTTWQDLLFSSLTGYPYEVKYQPQVRPATEYK